MKNTYPWQEKDIWHRAANRGLAMNERISRDIQHSADPGQDRVLDSALDSYLVECSSCGERYGLNEVFCRGGEVECENCRNS